MQIAFRVDASATIGTGHVMRCITLADALKIRGADCIFISRHLPGFLQNLITAKGHHSARIGASENPESIDELPHAHFLATSQQQDKEQTLAILTANPTDWLIVDHYGIDRRWETAMREHADKILVIDDLADRDHECDLLVDQNLYSDMATRYRQRIPSTAVTLLSVEYAMLRSEFAEARKSATVRSGKVRRLFIFFGGMDSANFTLPLLNALSALKLKDLKVDVVIGAEHPTREEIRSICQEQAYTCHVQTQDMAKLLLAADAAIGAGGSTSWERCCLGLPTLAFIVAPNQAALTHEADRLGLLKAAQADIQNPDALQIDITDFLSEDAAREQISQACLNAIDAMGAQRIVDRMNLPGVQLRTAEQADSELIFDWRNHPSIRAISINSDVILWASHQQWFSQILQNTKRPLYIAKQDGKEIGVIRFDIQGIQAEVSLYLAPNQIGKGLGTQLLLQGEQQLAKEHPNVRNLIATVLEGNEASHKLFRRCGYQFADSKYTKKY